MNLSIQMLDYNKNPVGEPVTQMTMSVEEMKELGFKMQAEQRGTKTEDIDCFQLIGLSNRVLYASPGRYDVEHPDHPQCEEQVNDTEEIIKKHLANQAVPVDAYTYTIEVEEERDAVLDDALGECTTEEERDELRERLEVGDVWAWCTVTVTCTHVASGIDGIDQLGGCCYTDEEDFKMWGSFEDMKSEALDHCEKECERLRVALGVS